MVGEKSGLNKGLEAVESKSRKMAKASRKRGWRGYVKNILLSDFNASLGSGVWTLLCLVGAFLYISELLNINTVLNKILKVLKKI